MEPFRVHCETCHSRLKIRSPEVIGEIHACPKCGSMVHIRPPAGWTPGREPTPGVAPNYSGDAALAISTTASVIIPASAADFAIPESLETPATEAPAAEAPPTEVVPAASGISPVVLWSASALAVLIIGAATFALWPKHESKVETGAVSSTVTDPKATTEQ